MLGRLNPPWPRTLFCPHLCVGFLLLALHPPPLPPPSSRVTLTPLTLTPHTPTGALSTASTRSSRAEGVRVVVVWGPGRGVRAHWGWRCYGDWQSRRTVRGCWGGAVFPVLSCRVRSGQVRRCRVMSCRVSSCSHVMRWRVMSCHVRRVVSCRVVSRYARLRYVAPRCRGYHLDSRSSQYAAHTYTTRTHTTHTATTHSRTTRLIRSRTFVFHPQLLLFVCAYPRFRLKLQMWGYPVLLFFSSFFACLKDS